MLTKGSKEADKLSVSDIVRIARGLKDQKAFAREIGKSQGSLSKYEAGKATPPRDVIEYCLDLIDFPAPIPEHPVVTAKQVAKRLLDDFNDPDYRSVMEGIDAILDGIENARIMCDG